jgi:ubiquinone/menaquinone biosynthesis C-methylase UbiE
MTKDDEPLALQAYEALAEAYAALVETKPHNAYYERPATLSILPDVKGKRVLDAGCGPGIYAELLVERGAEVIAIDASPKMIRFAGQRLGDRAEVRLADLGKPLDFLPDKSIDLVLSALTLDYVKDWEEVFNEFSRILRSSGWLIFSIQHPFAEYMTHPDGNYFEIEQVDYVWSGFGIKQRMPYYRRSISDIFQPLLAAGFFLDHLLEPRPTEQFRQVDPDDYATLIKRPGFMCIRARKP